MYIKTNQVLALLLSFVLLFSTSSFGSRVVAAENAVIATVNTEDGSAGEIITVTVTLPKDSQIYSGSFELVYDDSKLALISAQAGELIESRMNFVNPDFAVDTIKVVFAGASPITEEGELIKAQFEILETASGTADITIKNLGLSDVNAELVESSAVNDSIVITPKEAVAVAVQGAVGEPGSTVTVYVTISDEAVGNAYSGSFELVYNNTKLEVASTVAGNAFTEISPIINSNFATDKIKVTWASIMPFSTSGNLLEITFKILNGTTGTAALSLENVGLSDSSAELLPNVSTVDGIITITQHVHNWGAWTITNQPTQTETGTAERVCQNDSSHKDQKELPALTDTSVWTKGERVEPTCTVDGSQSYTSEYGTVTETLPATGHTFEWIIDRPATVEAPGIKHEECTKCHEKRNENTEIPQLPAESYVVHYDANGGSGTMPDGAAPKDKEFTLPENAFTPPAGKQFKCWAIGSIDGTEIQPGTGFIFTENTTVYAVWENIGFTITFDKNGGSSVSAETMVTNSDGKLGALPTATHSGSYRFKGWYTEKTGGTEVTKETVFTEDTTVYAQWTYTGGGGGGGSVTRYTVTFDTQGGSKIDSIRVIRNGTVTKPEKPTKEGYTFEGWFTDQECKVAFDFDTRVTKNITLYAKWTEEQPEEPTDPVEPENPDEWENPFDDVDKDDWFYDDVKNAYENGWFTGVTDTAFAPDEAITRGMMVTVLYRAENEPATAGKSKFADVAPDAYYTQAVIWAENNGIVKGYSEVEFAPDKLISREEMAAIMNRYAEYKGADTGVSGDLARFADQAQIADWARKNVAWAVGYGLLSGKENNLLDPQGHTTRAETAAILNRFLEK